METFLLWWFRLFCDSPDVVADPGPYRSVGPMCVSEPEGP